MLRRTRSWLVGWVSAVLVATWLPLGMPTGIARADGQAVVGTSQTNAHVATFDRSGSSVVLFPGDVLSEETIRETTLVDGRQTTVCHLAFMPEGVDSTLCEPVSGTAEVQTGVGETIAYPYVQSLKIVGTHPVLVQAQDVLEGPFEAQAEDGSSISIYVAQRLLAMRSLGEYALSYDLSGGTWADESNPNPASVPLAADDVRYELVAPKREGYRFAGWAGDSRTTALAVDDDALIVNGLWAEGAEQRAALAQNAELALVLEGGYTLVAQWEIDLDYPISVELTQKSLVYNGAQQMPAVEVLNALGDQVRSEIVQVSYTNNVEVGDGTASVAVVGDGFSVERELVFQITPADIAEAQVSSISGKTYTGRAIKPQPQATWNGTKLRQGVDFELSFRNNTKPGTAQVVLTGKGNFQGATAGTFKIARAKIAKAKVASVGKKTYTGRAFKPSPAVRMGNRKLKKGKDYTLSYKNNVKAGTATLVVKGKGGYQGTITRKFRIGKANFGKAKVTKVARKLYTSSAIKPKPKVTWKGKTLKLGRDYTLRYRNNKQVGTATVLVKGKGNYSGKTLRRTFEIYKTSLSSARISLDSSSLDWTGDPQCSGVSVYYQGKAMQQGRDYTVSYVNNTRPGTATAIIRGLRGFTGEVRKTYTITQGETVYLTRTGACYHASWCSSLRRSAIPTSLYNARSRGYRPCKICM